MQKALLTVAILLVWLSGWTQGAGQVKEFASPKAKAEAMLSKLYSACSPAGYQVSRINYALLDYYSGHDDLMRQPHPNQAEVDSKLKMMRGKLYQKIQTVLTPQQMQMWVAYKEKEKIEE